MYMQAASSTPLQLTPATRAKVVRALDGLIPEDHWTADAIRPPVSCPGSARRKRASQTFGLCGSMLRSTVRTVPGMLLRF